MSTKFSVGDHVSWNSEAGRVSGKSSKSIPLTSIIKAIPIERLRMIHNMKYVATKLTTSLRIRAVRYEKLNNPDA